MKLINGQKYSTRSFEDYKLRVMVRFYTYKPNNDGPYPLESLITIYTTEDVIEEVEEVIDELKSDKVKSFKIEHYATKEQDDIASKFIEGTLKDL